jgi:hypothetical protein
VLRNATERSDSRTRTPSSPLRTNLPVFP